MVGRKNVSQVMNDAHVVDKGKIKERVQNILKLRLENEEMLLDAINKGVIEERVTEGRVSASTVKEMSVIMNKMTPVDAVFKVGQIMDGAETESVKLTTEQVNKKLLMVVNFSESGALEKMDKLLERFGCSTQDGEVQLNREAA